VRLAFSREGSRADDALETLGGILQALPLLADAAGDEPFIAVSGDIVCDFDYRRLDAAAAAIRRGEVDAHLVLVDNPPFHPRGDMGLVACGDRGPAALGAARSGSARITTAPPWFTYANIGLFAPRLFRAEARGKKKLFPWLYRFADAGRVSGELFRGRWHNVGTPDDLRALDAELARLHCHHQSAS
jgi:MurNAc alpha-1-phosphate uridylyltransferase